MNVEVQMLNDVEVKVNVEVPAADVDAALAQQYREVAKSVTMRGFRKGKAPRKMLETRFGDEVKAEATRNLISANIEAALEKLEPTPLGEPIFDNEELKAHEPFNFSIQLEVRPELEPTDYKACKAPVVEIAVPDEEIDAELETVRQRKANFVPAGEEDEAAEGSFLTVDFEGKVDGEVFDGGTAENATVQIGAGRMIPGFEEALAGMKTGETRDIEVTFPDDYGAEELAGKPATFTVTLKEMKNKELPAIDDELAKDEDHDDLASWRAAVVERLTETKKREGEETRANAVLDQIIENNPFALPPRLVEREVNRRRQQMTEMMQRFGMPPESLGDMISERDEEFKKEAERGLRVTFLLSAIAKQEDVEASDEAVEKFIEEYAESVGQPVQKVKAQFHGEEMLEGLKLQVREKETRKKLLEWAVDGEPEAPAQAPEENDSEADEPAAEQEAGDATEE